MTVAELIRFLEQLPRNAEVMIRAEAFDYTILDALEDFHGNPTLFALEWGK